MTRQVLLRQVVLRELGRRKVLEREEGWREDWERWVGRCQAGNYSKRGYIP